jgi:hypothetical protein
MLNPFRPSWVCVNEIGSVWFSNIFGFLTYCSRGECVRSRSVGGGRRGETGVGTVNNISQRRWCGQNARIRPAFFTSLPTLCPRTCSQVRQAEVAPPFGRGNDTEFPKSCYISWQAEQLLAPHNTLLSVAVLWAIKLKSAILNVHNYIRTYGLITRTGTGEKQTLIIIHLCLGFPAKILCFFQHQRSLEEHDRKQCQLVDHVQVVFTRCIGVVYPVMDSRNTS